jgi:hypothetical protein
MYVNAPSVSNKQKKTAEEKLACVGVFESHRRKEQDPDQLI